MPLLMLTEFMYLQSGINKEIKMKVRVIYKPDKTVAVIHPAPKSKRKDETEEEWLERVFTKAMQGELKDLSYDDIDSSELPSSREDRNAWEGEKGKGISINIIKAEQIRKEKKKAELIREKLKEIAIKELEKEGKL
ncbi:hypothetical protein ES703_55985 [subsurface metagenome]